MRHSGRIGDGEAEALVVRHRALAGADQMGVDAVAIARIDSCHHQRPPVSRAADVRSCGDVVEMPVRARRAGRRQRRSDIGGGADSPSDCRQQSRQRTDQRRCRLPPTGRIPQRNTGRPVATVDHLHLATENVIEAQ